MQKTITKKSVLQGITISAVLLLMTCVMRGIRKDSTMLMLILWSIGIGIIAAVKIEITEAKIETKLLYLFPVIGLLVWGLLCVTPNLWYDEAYSAALISNSWEKVLKITSNDVHPPLYYFMLKAVYEIFGHSIQPLKVFSLLFLEAYMLLGVFPVRRILGTKIAAWFCFFSLCMPCMTVQSTNVRMYTLALYMVMLVGILAYEVYQKAGVKRWIYLGIASIVGIYVHTYTMISIMFIYLILLGAILFNRKKEKLLPFFLTGIITAVSYIPWLTVLFAQFKNRADTMGKSRQFSPYDFIDYFTDWFSSKERPYPLAVLFGCGLFIVLGYLVVDIIRKNGRKLPVVGVSVFALTAALGVFVSAKFVPSFMGRYAFPAIGFVWLFWAYGMSALKDSRAIGTIAITVMLIGALNYGEEWKLEYDKGLNTYNTFFEENISDNDAIMVSDEHILLLSNYHQDMQYFVYGYKEPHNPFLNTEAFQDYGQLEAVEGNIWYICYAGNSPYLLSEKYDSTQELVFHYQYYDLAIYRLIEK